MRKLKKYIKRWMRILTSPHVNLAKLQTALGQLKIRPNAPVLVHSSLSSFGYIQGGMPTVYQSLMDLVGKNGTLAIPTHSWDQVAKGMREFDARLTRSCVGAFTEWFRLQPGVVRSLHPTHSIAAIGPGASELVSGHEQCDTPCGSGTPYHKVLSASGTILLMGAPLDSNTCYHTLEALSGVDYLLQKATTDFALTDAHGRCISKALRLHQAGIRRNLGLLYRDLQNLGGISDCQVGGARVTAIDGELLLRAGMDLLKNNPRALLLASTDSKTPIGSSN